MPLSSERKNEIISISIVAFSIVTFLSLISNDANPQNNYIGILGHYYSFVLLYLFGFASYFIVGLLIIIGWNIFKSKDSDAVIIKGIGIIFFLISLTLFLEKFTLRSDDFYAGGAIGHILLNFLFLKFFGNIGTYIIIFTLLPISFLLITEFLFFPVYEKLKQNISENIKSKFKDSKSKYPKKEKTLISKKIDEINKKEEEIIIPEEPKPIKKIIRKVEKGEYQLPPLSLLKTPPKDNEQDVKEDLEENSRILEEALRSFEVESKVVNLTKGPVITRYEIELATGIKVNKILNLADDISLVLKATQVRIVAPVPGKGVVGIEVPNKRKIRVFLKELLESEQEKEPKGNLLIALGKNIAGDAYFVDLARMPHLLIAGTTGSGKSVCVNSLITNLLFKYTPEEVKFIIVDPKRVEMIVYDGIPHLLVPIIVDVKKASYALKWAAREMENRYEMFARTGARNIEEFNHAPIERKKYKEMDIEKILPNKLPYIIIIIDELADLMMIARKEVEDTITRLAQMARAVGIHLILATQRPSVDVITGLIKANFPSRIAFQVSSKVDSRTILDTNGAEKLTGEGDMLFYSASTGAFKPNRVQGAYISYEEIESVVKFVKTQAEPVYLDDILTAPIEDVNSNFPAKSDDPLFEDAVKIIQNSDVASVSLLQRKMKIGYNRASRLMDILESEGIVSPADGSKPRTVLIRKDWFNTDENGDDESL